MSSERIGDGAFVTANKLDFRYTNWEFADELFSNLTSQPSQKLQLKINSQKLKVKSKNLSQKLRQQLKVWVTSQTAKVESYKLKVKRQKLKVKS